MLATFNLFIFTLKKIDPIGSIIRVNDIIYLSEFVAWSSESDCQRTFLVLYI